MSKTGVLVLNFGGPNNLREVRGFLYRLFSDPYVLVGIKPPLRQMLAFFIATVKAGSSKKMYASIGGGSPQLHWTKLQLEGLRNLFTDREDVKIEIGMRLSDPTIEAGLAKLKKWGASRVILLPLFSQYSLTTTASCFAEVTNALNRMRWSPELLEIDEWCDNEEYIALLRQTVDEKVAEVLAEKGDVPYVLFSAHSLPMKIVERGDPYLGHVQRSVDAVTKNLQVPWSLAFQSRNGPIAWAEPYVEDELIRLGKAGVKNIVVVPLSFVCDHVETLFELDQVYADLAKNAGIEGFYRARTFNDDPQFPLVLKSVLERTGLQ